MNTSNSAHRCAAKMVALSLCLAGSLVRVSGQEATVVSDRTLRPSSDIVVRTEQRDGNADGTIDHVVITTSKYDRRGNPLTIVVEGDFDVDGVADDLHTTTSTYDPRGHVLTAVLEHDSGANGIVDETRTITSTYDERGNLQTQSSEYDGNGDGYVDQTQTTNHTYDSAGRLLTETVTHSSEGIQTLLSTAIHSYDAKGRLLSRWFETHLGEFNGGDLVGTTRNTYDSRGNLLTETTEFDLEMNGTIDSFKTTTNTYDRQGHLLVRRMERGFDPYEPATDYNYLLEITTNDFDTNGNLVGSVLEWDMGFPGAAYPYIGAFNTTNTYDRRRNLLRTTTQGDAGRDGSINFRQISNNSYDHHNRLLVTILDIDSDGTGARVERTTTTLSYRR